MYNALIACVSENNARYLKETMSPAFRVQCCFTCREALEILQTQKPEILVVELSVPEADGLSLLRETAWKPPVVLALAHSFSPQAKRRALLLGVQTIVYLPAAPEQILAHLARMTADHLEAPTAATP